MTPRKPWPVPAVPGHEGKGPTVLEIPTRDALDFARHIAPGLASGGMSGLLISAAASAKDPTPTALDDRQILDLHFSTIFSRSITTTLDPRDEAAFAPLLRERRHDATYFKLDFSAIERLRLLPKLYAAPTVTLGRIDADGTRSLLAIRISGLVLTPADGEAWALARYFVMQGAGLHAVLVRHTPLHFQYDAIAAIASSILPPTHSLARLLAPHFRFTLMLNRAALHSRLSILTNNQLLPFATFPADEASVHKFQSTGWSGIEGNSAYPAYRFHATPPPLFGELDGFLRGYYDVIHDLTRVVAAAIDPADTVIATWADEVAKWVPGFPSASEIAAPGVLARVAASCVWGASVVHATEHYGLMEDIPLAAIPMRLRIPPPFARDIRPFDRRALVTRVDAFRQKMAWDVLVRNRAATRLADVDYGFESSDPRRANDELHAGLRRVDGRSNVHRFAPLERMAQSIQY